MKPLDELDENGTGHDLVVIGASAGGVEALKRVVADLPGDLPAAVCIVLHIAPSSPSALAGILARAGPLPCRFAGEEQPLRCGEIIVAPPDHHLAVEDGRVRLTVGPRENGHRPAVDVLFRTAAVARDSRVVGVILSGTRDDGAAGLAVVKAEGGSAVVQSPDDALYPGMPVSALANVVVDAVVPAERIGETISAIVKGQPLPDDARPHVPDDDPDKGDRLTSVCPECGGVLTERVEAGVPYWECHVGHRYSPSSFAHAQGAGVEAALWTAVRALRDRGALLRRIAEQFEGRGQTASGRRFRGRADEAYRQADLVLEMLTEAAATTLGELSEPDEAASGAAGVS
jgi:two-component system, chemotaxis family, protein-glutamate methylesterase/glutaminase